MPSNFSLMIVDEDREVRDCLTELFLGTGYAVRQAEGTEGALGSLPEDAAAWPDVIILGQATHSIAGSFLARARDARPGLANHASLIVFPSFPVPVGAHGGERRLVQACRLSAVANLLSLVRGLAHRKGTAQVLFGGSYRG